MSVYVCLSVCVCSLFVWHRQRSVAYSLQAFATSFRLFVARIVRQLFACRAFVVVAAAASAAAAGQQAGSAASASAHRGDGGGQGGRTDARLKRCAGCVGVVHVGGGGG